jgi:hypothetical protein
MGRTLTFIAALAVVGLGISISDKLQSQSSPSGYTYRVHHDDSNGHFIVDITNTAQVALICQIQYSGRTFLDAEVNGHRTVVLRPRQQNNGPTVASTHYSGFRDFKAAVQCNAK